MIEGGDHLWRCLKYIDLNMVRAGVVNHPSGWEWTGWKELMGQRKRNRLISMDKLLRSVGASNVDDFRVNYQASVEESIALGRMKREACWTESVAVGSQAYVQSIEEALLADYSRRQMSHEQNAQDQWTLKETNPAGYSSKKDPKNRPIAGSGGANSVTPC